MTDFRALLGPIDIYLFDQLHRGRIAPGMRIFDAGCGGGRNLLFFLRQGYDVMGVDASIDSIDRMHRNVRDLAPSLSLDAFRHESVEQTTFPAACAEVVLSIAVLHFAKDDRHFERMLRASWDRLAVGGLFFARLATTIGIEDELETVDTSKRRYLLPDGSERYLADEEVLSGFTRSLGAELLDPIKTTVVQHQRSMTTWVLRKT